MYEIPHTAHPSVQPPVQPVIRKRQNINILIGSHISQMHIFNSMETVKLAKFVINTGNSVATLNCIWL